MSLRLRSSARRSARSDLWHAGRSRFLLPCAEARGESFVDLLEKVLRCGGGGASRGPLVGGALRAASGSACACNQPGGRRARMGGTGTDLAGGHRVQWHARAPHDLHAASAPLAQSQTTPFTTSEMYAHSPEYPAACSPVPRCSRAPPMPSGGSIVLAASDGAGGLRELAACPHLLSAASPVRPARAGGEGEGLLERRHARGRPTHTRCASARALRSAA
jgi:hypothetical protein